MDSPQSNLKSHLGAGQDRLRLSEISKSFPGVQANESISFSVGPGEIHALLGENGAGKSTLVKIIYGALSADSGQIFWEGEEVSIASPAQARRMGIGMVFQHFSLFNSLTVTENILLGLEENIGREDLAERILDVSQRYGLAINPHRHIEELSVGERQRVEIVRCLLQSPRLLIMDEPTSVLTPQEADALFETLENLRKTGCSILYISHKLDEIRRLCDRATILRGGKVVATCDPRQETARSLASMMIGSELRDPVRQTGQGEALAEVKLAVKDLSLPALNPTGSALKGISFELRAGQILGIAGVAGNGQSELMAALSGERLAPHSKDIFLCGQAVGRRGARYRRRLAMTVVPEDRLGQGAVANLSLSENLSLTGYDRFTLLQRGFLKRERAKAITKKVIEAFAVKASGPEAEARSLSGGNLQKFIVGREIEQNPEVLVVAAPTWGVDAGSAAAIHQALLDLAEQGAAILVVSQDLDELKALADVIAVLFHGTLSKPLAAAKADPHRLGLLMGGAHPEESDLGVAG